jgi:putative PIN family toxin of toxin-antitoxin system
VKRAIFDCMVFLQAAARSSGPSGACLQAVRDGRLELVISPEIIAEVRGVLTRPRTLRKFPALTVEAVEVFVGAIEALAVTVSDVPGVFVLERDPKDEPYLNLAIASGAAYLTTWDKDLLDLIGDEASRKQFPALTILEPTTLLRTLQPK